MNDFTHIKLEPLCAGCREEDVERRRQWTSPSTPLEVALKPPPEHDETCGRWPVRTEAP